MQAGEFRHAIGDWKAALPHPRMAVYRNNVSAALVTALKVRFPVTAQLVGQEFFAAMALVYADGHRPNSPVLIDYGHGLPDFIRGFEPADALVYLGDMAQLESLWWQAYHAADAAPLQPAALAGLDAEALGGLRFVLHPSVGLQQSRYAAGSIWQAHHGGPPLSAVRIDQPECILVTRPGAEVSIRLIQPERFAFLCVLQQGNSLSDAVEAALDIHPGFDIAAELAAFLAANLATGFSI